ncbi:MAG: hypothetical protein EON50_15745 [Acidovorax sp.]|nr:MAG: hypothetical protein EON50_15745 [Acidovorax sp.]
MNAIDELRSLHFRSRTGLASWQDCVDWATERLRHDDEGDDLDVVTLAGARKDEVPPLVTQILERYLGAGALSNQVAAGKFIVDLYDAYKSGEETAVSLDPRIWRVYYDFDQPTWLVMLARNCEYATDIPDFRAPFEEEFEYIANLWRSATTENEFEAAYDSRISRSHDLPALIQSAEKKPWWRLW